MAGTVAAALFVGPFISGELIVRANRPERVIRRYGWHRTIPKTALHRVALLDLDKHASRNWSIKPWVEHLAAEGLDGAAACAEEVDRAFQRFTDGDCSHDELAAECATSYAAMMKDKRQDEIAGLTPGFAADEEELYAFVSTCRLSGPTRRLARSCFGSSVRGCGSLREGPRNRGGLRPPPPRAARPRATFRAFTRKLFSSVIDLYYRPGAASLVVHAALEEAGAEYNLIRATRENGVFGPREAARLNPDGRVPTMSFDGLAMTESAACLMHISDLYPAADLAPAPGTPARGLWYRWLVYLVNPVQSTFYGFIAPARSAPPDAQEAVATHAVEALDGYRASLDDHLAERGPYLLGERFTSADLFLFMLTRWGRRLEHRWWDAPTLGAHYRTIKERPAIQRVFEQEGLDDAL